MSRVQGFLSGTGKRGHLTQEVAHDAPVGRIQQRQRTLICPGFRAFVMEFLDIGKRGTPNPRGVTAGFTR